MTERFDTPGPNLLRLPPARVLREMENVVLKDCRRACDPPELKEDGTN